MLSWLSAFSYIITTVQRIRSVIMFSEIGGLGTSDAGECWEVFTKGHGDVARTVYWKKRTFTQTDNRIYTRVHWAFFLPNKPFQAKNSAQTFRASFSKLYLPQFLIAFIPQLDHHILSECPHGASNLFSFQFVLKEQRRVTNATRFCLGFLSWSPPRGRYVRQRISASDRT